MKLWTVALAPVIFVSLSHHASADAFKPSKAQQVQLGKRAATELRSKEHVLPSSDPRVREVRRVGARLLSTVNLRGDPWEFSFDVIDSKQVNAFALPGGPTFVYTGLYDKCKSEDEIAGVMGHELTHVLREHWAYAYANSQKRNLLLTLGLTLLRANNTIGNLAGITNEVVFGLPFSRKDETQADEGGLNMMIKAGYNPQGMVDVFTLLRDLQKGGRPPQWLSDHPDDRNRIRHMQEIISQTPGSYPPERPLPGT